MAILLKPFMVEVATFILSNCDFFASNFVICPGPPLKYPFPPLPTCRTNNKRCQLQNDLISTAGRVEHPAFVSGPAFCPGDPDEPTTTAVTTTQEPTTTTRAYTHVVGEKKLVALFPLREGGERENTTFPSCQCQRHLMS